MAQSRARVKVTERLLVRQSGQRSAARGDRGSGGFTSKGGRVEQGGKLSELRSEGNKCRQNGSARLIQSSVGFRRGGDVDSRGELSERTRGRNAVIEESLELPEGA